MSDYISREAFLEKERRLYCQDCSRRKNSNGKLVYEIGDAPCRACGIGDVLDDFEDIPAADVRENVKGEWVVHKTKIGNEYTTCSNCKIDFSFLTDKGTLAKLDMRGTNFCPNCGADMREES